MMPSIVEDTNKSNYCIQQSNETMEYEVKNHDTLCKIAVNYNTTTSYLRKLNKLNSAMIFPGQILLVPSNEIENDKNISMNKEDLSLSFASNMENAYAFLSPLSISQNGSDFSPAKPFKDLCVVSTDDQTNISDQEERRNQTSSSSSDKIFGADKLEAFRRPVSTQASLDNGEQYNGKANRERLASIESLSSEPFEENFLKMNVHYLNETTEHVRGILLITPTSTMFDPDPSCPMAREHGCEKFGVMCDMAHIVSLTMYRDAKETSDRESPISNKEAPPTNLNDNDIKEASPNKSASDEFATEHGFVSINDDRVDSVEKVLKADDKKDLQRSFSVVDGSSISDCSPESEFLYFCIRSTQPMMKTFSVLSALTDDADNVTEEKDVKEAWFHVPRRNSDQLMAFFMQWNPDPYALDFAEQNGFMVAESFEEKKKKKTRKESGKRSRSSTSTTSSACSSDFTVSSEHESIGEKKIEKEWELVSIEEAKRRTELNANELANDDTSLIPELRHRSNLIKDHTLLELCKRMPARCIGCPWKLSYSTFEHGMSLKTLYRKMEQRDPDEHPVFIIVQDTEGCIFGAFSSSSPHMSDHFYGSGESFLFTLEPEVKFFDWTGENNFFIKGDSDALMLGGGDGSAGLWIDGDLYHGRSHPCLTFNNSVLSLTEDFLIQDVEVWSFEDN